MLHYWRCIRGRDRIFCFFGVIVDDGKYSWWGRGENSRNFCRGFHPRSCCKYGGRSRVWCNWRWIRRWICGTFQDLRDFDERIFGFVTIGEGWNFGVSLFLEDSEHIFGCLEELVVCCDLREWIAVGKPIKFDGI